MTGEFRQVKFSCGVFGGYTTWIEYDSHQDTLATLTDKAVQDLASFLQQCQLMYLSEAFFKIMKEYHIHEPSSGNVNMLNHIKNHPDEVVWICSHLPPVVEHIVNH